MTSRLIQHERELLEAIALYYDQQQAPKVIAKGEGNLAAEIIAMGKQYGVHLHEDPALLEQLSSLDVGDNIPEHLFYIIAEIIAYVYHLEGKTPEQNPGF
jgi:flagellar biosynthesis protein